MAHNAAHYSQAYTYARALLTYRELHGFIPGQDDLVTELKTLPDPDGSIAAALQSFDISGYQPGSFVASGPTKSKPMPLRGEVIRKASMSIPVADHGGISFTNYDLRLPGFQSATANRKSAIPYPSACLIESLNLAARS